jgi:hypothetical protein
MNRLLIVAATTIILLATAGATVVTSIPSGTVNPMPVVNYFGPWSANLRTWDHMVIQQRR